MTYPCPYARSWSCDPLAKVKGRPSTGRRSHTCGVWRGRYQYGGCCQVDWVAISRVRPAGTRRAPYMPAPAPRRKMAAGSAGTSRLPALRAPVTSPGSPSPRPPRPSPWTPHNRVPRWVNRDAHALRADYLPLTGGLASRYSADLIDELLAKFISFPQASDGLPKCLILRVRNVALWVVRHDKSPADVSARPASGIAECQVLVD
jgi:hypothetical protein